MSMVQFGAHVALDRPDGALGVGDGLALGHLADEHLAVLGEGHHRRGGAGALGVGDDDRIAALEDGDDGVGGAEVDTDGLGHGWVPSVSQIWFVDRDRCCSGEAGASEIW
jgi:hypothetical protein